MTHITEFRPSGTLSTLGFAGAVGFLIYVGSLYFYRLFLHPLSKYPGPKLAAMTNWYEFYYDVILQGKFTPHIQDLHKKYG
jgi:hypothetical protein